MLKTLFLTLLLTVDVGWAESAPATSTEIPAANALLAARKIPEARAAFEEILRHAPGNPDAHYGLGLLDAEAGQWESALQHQEKAVTANPNHARYQYGWGMANGIAAQKAGVLAKFGHAKKCLAAYQRAVELEPRALPYRWALLRYYQQAPAIVGGGFDKAYAEAAEIKAINADSGRQAYAQLYVAEKKFDLAFREFEEALRESPDNLVMLYQFGRLTLTTGQRLEEGLAAFQRCVDQAADAAQRANARWRIGSIWEQRKDLAKAREAYHAALKEQPDFRPAKDALAKLDEAAGKAG